MSINIIYQTIANGRKRIAFHDVTRKDITVNSYGIGVTLFKSSGKGDRIGLINRYGRLIETGNTRCCILDAAAIGYRNRCCQSIACRHRRQNNRAIRSIRLGLNNSGEGGIII